MRYFLIPAFGLLAACSTPEDMASTCQSYGFKPGTNSFAQCMQVETNERRERIRRGLAGLSEASKPQPMIRPTNTTCRNSGYGRISCTTF